MKSYTIVRGNAENHYRIYNDAKPSTDYATYTFIGLLQKVAELSRAGHRVAIENGEEERVICQQMPDAGGKA